MSEDTAVAAPVNQRRVLRTADAEVYIKTHTATQLREIAAELKFELPEEAKTKQQIYDAMITAAKFPDQSLRGKSTVAGPVGYVWGRCEELFAAGTEEAPVRRKDVQAQLESEGVAYYTARTQIQAWSSATAKGTRAIADLSQDELPKSMRTQTEADDG